MIEPGKAIGPAIFCLSVCLLPFAIRFFRQALRGDDSFSRSDQPGTLKRTERQNSAADLTEL